MGSYHGHEVDAREHGREITLGFCACQLPFGLAYLLVVAPEFSQVAGQQREVTLLQRLFKVSNEGAVAVATGVKLTLFVFRWNVPIVFATRSSSRSP